MAFSLKGCVVGVCAFLLLLFFLSAFGIFALYLRLSQGPVELSFLNTFLQKHMVEAFSGLKIDAKAVILEWDEGAPYPQIRLQTLRLENAEGHLLLRVPKAHIWFSPLSLVWGPVQIHQLELIGPKILLKRRLDGQFEMGFGNLVETTSSSAPLPSSQVLQGDGEDKNDLLDYFQSYLKDQRGDTSSFVSSLEKIRIKQASLSLYDEANRIVWSSPEAHLSFKKTGFGFSILSDAQISTRAKPWHTQVVANYRFDRKTITLSARVFDLIPASIAQQTFAFSQFAQVDIPLSGQATFEIAEDGRVIQASAELSASQGRVGLPHYLSKPIAIEEGLLRFDYDPKTESIILMDNSELIVSGTKTELKGAFTFFRDPQGTLTSIGIDFASHHRTLPKRKGDRLDFEDLSFSGHAFLDDRRLEVRRFSLSSPEKRIDFSGYFMGGEKTSGLYLTGSLAHIPLETLQKIWPGAVAPSANSWVFNHIRSGTLTEGTFHVALSPEDVERALSGAPLPDDGVNFSFKARGINGQYYKDLPPVRDLSIDARITGTRMDLDMHDGVIEGTIPGQIHLISGTMRSFDISGAKIPTHFTLKANSELSTLLHFIDLPALSLLENDQSVLSSASGKVDLALSLNVPLGERTPGDLKVGVTADLTKARYKDQKTDLGFEDGDMRLTILEDIVRLTGRAKIFGKPATLTWQRDLSKPESAPQPFSLRGTFTEQDFKKLDLTIDDFLKGPSALHVVGELVNGDLAKAHITMDLSQATLLYAPLDWQKTKEAGVKATLDFHKRPDQKMILSPLSITGPGVKISANMVFSPSGRFLEGQASSFLLEPFADLSFKATSSQNTLEMTLSGKKIDLSGFVRRFFTHGGTDSQISQLPKSTALDRLKITGAVTTLNLNQGEKLLETDFSATLERGSLHALDLKGRFEKNGRFRVLVSPQNTSEKTIRLSSENAGSVLRAIDLYTKVSGGHVELKALMDKNKPSMGLRGEVVFNSFLIKNDPLLSGLGQTQKDRSLRGTKDLDILKFSKLRFSFSKNQDFFYIKDLLAQGNEIGGSGRGTIRLQDTALDIKGTIIPMYSLNSVLGHVPIVGDILLGGRGQGVFGLNFSLQGTLKKPNFSVNPVSALAPGFLRQLFSVGKDVDFDHLPYQ